MFTAHVTIALPLSQSNDLRTVTARGTVQGNRARCYSRRLCTAIPDGGRARLPTFDAMHTPLLTEHRIGTSTVWSSQILHLRIIILTILFH